MGPTVRYQTVGYRYVQSGFSDTHRADRGRSRNADRSESYENPEPSGDLTVSGSGFISHTYEAFLVTELKASNHVVKGFEETTWMTNVTVGTTIRWRLEDQEFLVHT